MINQTVCMLGPSSYLAADNLLWLIEMTWVLQKHAEEVWDLKRTFLLRFPGLYRLQVNLLLQEMEDHCDVCPACHYCVNFSFLSCFSILKQLYFLLHKGLHEFNRLVSARKTNISDSFWQQVHGDVKLFVRGHESAQSIFQKLQVAEYVCTNEVVGDQPIFVAFFADLFEQPSVKNKFRDHSILLERKRGRKTGG